jgi:hypothetical protein
MTYGIGLSNLRQHLPSISPSDRLCNLMLRHLWALGFSSQTFPLAVSRRVVLSLSQPLARWAECGPLMSGKPAPGQQNGPHCG